MNEEDFLKSIGGSYVDEIPTTTPIKKNGVIKNILNGAKDIGVGLLKGAGETLGSVAVNVEKPFKDIASTNSNKEYASLLDDINTQNRKIMELSSKYPNGDPQRQKYMNMLRQNQEQADILREDFFGTGGVQESIENAGLTKGINNLTTATNKTQQFGKGAEKVGEFLVSGKAATGLIPKGTTASTRVLSNTAQGLAGGFLPSAMSSASQGQFDNKTSAKVALKEAGVSGITGAGVSGVLSGVGEGLRALKLPSRLISNVYKTDKKTVEKIFSGQDVDTERLSDWAVKNKLSGSLEKQATKLNTILKNSEDQVIKSAEASKVKIPIHENLFALAQNIAKDYQNIGRGEIASSADDFLRGVKDNTVSVKDAIKFRRVLDKIRPDHSFTNPKFGNDLSYWSDDLRRGINNSDGIGAINKEYSSAIKARDALIKYATSTGNTKALSAMETYFVGGGGLAGEAGPATLVLGVKRVLQSPKVRSIIAQSVQDAKPSINIRNLTSKVSGDIYRKNKENKILSSLQKN